MADVKQTLPFSTLKWLILIIVFLSCFAFASLSYAISAQKLVINARSQIGQTLSYDPAYTKLDYPMGDVPLYKGVCTDVIIRALRLQNMDLQQLIHEDMKANFGAYPKKWGLKSTDRNIDHRRVPNIATYFQRQGYRVQKAPFQTAKFQAGDIVTWDLGKGLTHIGIVSNRKSAQQIPLIIHNIGRGTQEEDILLSYKITGHYRILE
ncbi:hypothetical protein SAMN05421749_101263 [Acinetobacter marinus]|uniref:NADH:ubiquinone oxidoreductase, Na n=1 Tax=Acinetobacter marinus TaxID=281375 RepID=A0A1G6GQ37_9GAMM|nr:DUF1287 domain-containing protein [Acinetobacter marinus]SDB84061.1 hypothetical protein SAMN05421749_101263 [Acinetobacter marinus]